MAQYGSIRQSGRLESKILEARMTSKHTGFIPRLSSFFEELPGVGNSLAEMAPLLWMKHHCNFSSSPHPLYQQMSFLSCYSHPRCLRPQLSRSWRSYRTSSIRHLHRFRLVHQSCTRDVHQCLSIPWLLLHSDVLCLSSARTSCSFL